MKVAFWVLNGYGSYTHSIILIANNIDIKFNAILVRCLWSVREIEKDEGVEQVRERNCDLRILIHIYFYEKVFKEGR